MPNYTTAQDTGADNIPGLMITANNDGTITLEQEWTGNVDRVAIHPIHLRYLAEKLGLVREVSASDAELLRTERGRIEALRQENDRLKRNMLRLHQHALALQADFRENADWKHADLAHEMNNINSLVDLFDMAVDDFADDYTPVDPPLQQLHPAGNAPPQQLHPPADGAPAGGSKPKTNPAVTQREPAANPAVTGDSAAGGARHVAQGNAAERQGTPMSRAQRDVQRDNTVTLPGGPEQLALEG